MANKQKIKELLDKLEQLDGKKSSVGAEVTKLTDSLIEEEISSLTAKLKGNPTIKILQQFSNELLSFKKTFDLKPVVEMVKRLEASIEENNQTLLSEFQSKLEAIEPTNLEPLRKEFEIKLSNVPNHSEDIKAFQEQLQILAENDIESDTRQQKSLEQQLNNLRAELLTKLGNSIGSHANRNISVNGNSSVLSRYTDVNFKAGSNISLTYANNNTTKNLDLTITATGGAAGGGTVNSVLGGTGIVVDSTDPTIPIVILGNTSVVSGTYGSASTVPRITIDQQGRISSASTVGITFPAISAVSSVVGGVGIDVNNSNPSAPVVTRASIVGDITVPNNSNIATLASVITAAGPVGSATVIPVITFDNKGRLTTVTSITSSGGSGTPGGSDTQVQFNDASSFGGQAGFTYNKNTSVVGMVKATLANGTTANALLVTQTGNTSASISVGGAVNITNTSNTGAGLVVYSNGSAGQVGRQFVVYSQASALGVDTALIQSDATSNTALNVKGVPTNKGVVKIEHFGNTAGDSNGSGLSIALGNGVTATSVQGIFLDAPTTGTDGKLLNIKNAGSDKLVLASSGALTLNAAITFPTADGSTNQVLTTNGLGALYFSSVAATGGSGITRTTSVITASATASNAASTDYVYLCAAGLKLTLPTAISNNNLYTVKNTSNSSVLIVTSAGQSIDGSSTALMPVQNQSLSFISNNSVWGVV